MCYVVTLPQAISASKLLGIPCAADLFVSSASVAASHSVRALISFRSFRDSFKHFSNSCFFSVTCRKENLWFLTLQWNRPDGIYITFSVGHFSIQTSLKSLQWSCTFSIDMSWFVLSVSVILLLECKHLQENYVHKDALSLDF